MFSESLKNQNKNLVVNIGDAEFLNLVVRLCEQVVWALIVVAERIKSSCFNGSKNH